MKLRTAERTIKAQSTSDGAGVQLHRSIGTHLLDHLDPFLLLDEIRSDQAGDYIAGFPDHPHRGFETVTYMLAGRMEHHDHVGNRGSLVAGSAQWMTAGRGIIHSEMPKQEEGLLWGFQLWVNLPAKLKMSPPRYQDIPPEDIPEVTGEGSRVRVIAGKVGDRHGPVRGIATEPIFLDVSLEPGVHFVHDIPVGHNAFAYIVDGNGTMGITEAGSGTEIGSGNLLVLENGDAIKAATGESPMRFLLLAAAPIGEPIARHGPFVMNTREELAQAFEDLRNGTFLESETDANDAG